MHFGWAVKNYCNQHVYFRVPPLPQFFWIAQPGRVPALFEAWKVETDAADD